MAQSPQEHTSKQAARKGEFMHKSLKTTLSNLAGLIQQAGRDMTAISNDSTAREYGPRYIAGQRIKKLTDAQKAGQAILAGFLAQDWPAIQEGRATQAATILSKLKDGPSVRQTNLSNDELTARGITSTEAREVYRQGERMRGEILQQLEAGHRLAAEQHALVMHGMRSTEELKSLIESYRQGAKGDLAGFPYEAWKADRAVLPLILAQRAAAKDDRAGMLMQSNFVAEIENLVVQQSVEPDLDSQFFIERAQDALDNMISLDGGVPVENLKAAEELFGQVERRIGREDGRAPSTVPAPVEPAPPAKPASTEVVPPAR